ncbi:MAG TPA: sugar transferase [Longimicrobiales bacterium]
MKRFIDVTGALIGLLVLAVPMLLIALAVRVQLGSPVLFRQTRAGRHGAPFTMIKFRTMADRRGADGQMLPDEQRITPLGSFLRHSSLDELPELWNVLRGDMSFVGPRPLLMDYLPLYSPEQARRHEVRPGITGWAQVNGRNAVGWEDRFALDTWYVDHHTIALDLKILLRTIGRVFSREGVSPPGEVIMPRFTGAATRNRES